jgi:hypothetical protein
MEKPETLHFRHNTGNTAYGFEQTVNRPVAFKPTHIEGILPDGDFPYNYTVAGNQQMHRT